MWVQLVFRVHMQNANKYLILFLREACCAWRGCVILDLHRQVGKPLCVEWLRSACSPGISDGFTLICRHPAWPTRLPLELWPLQPWSENFSFISSQGLACPDIINAPRTRLWEEDGFYSCCSLGQRMGESPCGVNCCEGELFIRWEQEMVLQCNILPCLRTWFFPPPVLLHVTKLLSDFYDTFLVL